MNFTVNSPHIELETKTSKTSYPKKINWYILVVQPHCCEDSPVPHQYSYLLWSLRNHDYTSHHIEYPENKTQHIFRIKILQFSILSKRLQCRKLNSQVFRTNSDYYDDCTDLRTSSPLPMSWCPFPDPRVTGTFIQLPSTASSSHCVGQCSCWDSVDEGWLTGFWKKWE